jgi:hypothetical protein
VLFSNGPNKAFLVPDSCRATVRNGFSIHVDVTDDTIENNLNEACFSYLFVNLAVVLDFLILQDKHNICTLSLNIKLICTRCETGKKASQRLTFLPVSKAGTNKLCILRQCKYIIYKGGEASTNIMDFIA